jgi:2-haloacid dehalogenase
MIAGSIDGTVELVHELKARGVRIYVLSNMEPETFPKRLERFDFLRLFDGHVVSGFEGVIKPEPEIFHRLLQRYDLTPPRTMFVDDSEVNIDAATALGIDAVLFESPEQIRRELEARGLLPR